MIIKEVIIKNLHGYLSKHISFNSDINLIVGINGSGKTSLLNVVNWLLTPSFPDLCTNEFEELSVQFINNKEEFIITCKQTQDSLSFEIFNLSKNIEYPKINTDLKIHPRKIIDRSLNIEDLKDEYRRLTPERHEIETWNLIFHDIPKPVIIGLDRNLYTEEGNDISYVEENGIIRKRLNSIGKRSPLDKVMRLSGSEYSRYKNRILDLNRRLNDKIMLSSFEDTISIENINELLDAPRISLKQVQSLEIKVKEYFAENFRDNRIQTVSRIKNNEETFSKIETYFNNLKKLLSQFNEKDKKEKFDIIYITNLNQFRKIRELIKEFEEFETKSKRLYESLKQYLETINIFLRDSAKELYFEKNSSRLQFRILDKNKKIIKENREIKDLSSGEMQILILFTFIKFNNRLGKLFIIDEPELSLHPKWQENFIEGIKKIMPQDTQLIFATHSPAIVGKNKDYCKILMPF